MLGRGARGAGARTVSTAARPFATAEFLDLDFACATVEQVLAWLAERRAGHAFAYVVTPNVDHMVRLGRAPVAIRAIYAEADLCLCDSRVLARIAGLHGVSLPVVPGSDLVRLAFDRLFAPGDRICLIGGDADTAAALGALYPGIAFVQHVAPMGLLHDADARRRAVDAAASAQARIVLIAVGSPQQELLAWEMRESGRVAGTALCIGASVDFVVGRQVRAPVAMQRVGLEWAWRLIGQPRRMWRRYLVEGPAIFGMARAWARDRRRAAAIPRRGGPLV